MPVTARRVMERMLGRALGPALVWLAGACASPTPAPTPAPAQTAPEVVAPDPMREPWLVGRDAATARFLVTLESELASRIDTVSQRDSSRVVVEAEWTRIAGTTPARLSGMLSGYAVSRDSSPPVALAELRVPFPVVAELRADAPRMVRPEPAACAAESAAAAPLREALVTVPERLMRGDRWRDSLRYTICRDSIPLDVTVVRDFEAVGAERRGDAVVVLVARRLRLSMHGAGTQFGERIEISAEGAGDARLEIGLTDGLVRAGAGTQDLRMVMRGRRRSQELVQRTRFTLAAR